MSWNIVFLDEAKADLRRLDRSVLPQVLKGIHKVAQNSVSIHEGGYGKPLGNRKGSDLTGLFKIKFRDIGIRVVYHKLCRLLPLRQPPPLSGEAAERSEVGEVSPVAHRRTVKIVRIEFLLKALPEREGGPPPSGGGG